METTNSLTKINNFLFLKKCRCVQCCFLVVPFWRSRAYTFVQVQSLGETLYRHFIILDVNGWLGQR